MSAPPQNGHDPAGISSPSPAQPRIRDLAFAVEAAESRIRAGGRQVLGIVGPPGAGKSTVGQQLVDALGAQAVLVPMDGFHFAQAELVRQGQRDRMGAPDTFDVAGYAALLTRLRDRSESVVHAPRFDRSIEEPIAGALAIPASATLIITEGNYLLHDGDGWDRIAPLLDASWYLDVPELLREERLVLRRMEHGDDPEHSFEWVRTVDARNAALVARTRPRADAILALEEDR